MPGLPRGGKVPGGSQSARLPPGFRETRHLAGGVVLASRMRCLPGRMLFATVPTAVPSAGAWGCVGLARARGKGQGLNCTSSRCSGRASSGSPFPKHHISSIQPHLYPRSWSSGHPAISPGAARGHPHPRWGKPGINP